MRPQTLLLILQRQFSNKWGRFLLASGGIMIGVWAISLTTSLSLGLTDTIVTAINSQPAAREITLSRTESGQSNFFEISEAPKFVPISLNEIQQLKNDVSTIQDIAPDVNMNLFVQLPEATAQTRCVEQDVVVSGGDLSSVVAAAVSAGISIPEGVSDFATDSADSNIDLSKQKEELASQCQNIAISSSSFSNFYANNKSNWIGKTETPGRGEIIACFKCGTDDFNQKLGANEPKDLLNRELKIELQRAPELYPAGKVVDVTNISRPKTTITTSEVLTFKIVGVIDDRQNSGFGPSPYYIDYSYFTEAFKRANPEVDVSQYGTNTNTVFIKDYKDLDQTIKDIQAKKYLVFSLVQVLIQSVVTFFNVLTIVLSGFGLIALIASVFGIVNVMTISVLERQKEIGILKSLGAKNSDIFLIFLIESASLGFLGWLLGILLALGTGNLITTISTALISSNSDWKRNLDALNITTIAPSFPAWLFLGTLGIALFFTILSGIFPSIKASRQNPVDVLRSE